MVSQGLVMSDANNVRNAISNYASQVDDLSSSWKGMSYDNLNSQASEFAGNAANITSQMSSFANAIEVYESYKRTKESYDKYISIYNNEVRFSGDQSLIKQYLMFFSETEQEMRNLASKINSYLAEASSFHMDATKANSQPTSGASSTSGTQSTSSTNTSNHQVSTEGGTFIADGVYGEFGHIESSIDGKLHTIYNQSQIAGWATNCNRAAAASIASAFDEYDGQAVDVAKGSQNGIGYDSQVTNNYFSQFGLSAEVNRINGSYDTIKDDLVSTLLQGDYVMFDLSEPHVRGQSGQEWTSTRHWVSVLDIKQTGDGPEDYAIFVSDSGHGASSADHGLGAGWYSINEFTGQNIANFTTVTSN